MAKAMQVPVITTAVKRERITETQTKNTGWKDGKMWKIVLYCRIQPKLKINIFYW